jgi:hypothetical protein
MLFSSVLFVMPNKLKLLKEEESKNQKNAKNVKIETLSNWFIIVVLMQINSLLNYRKNQMKFLKEKHPSMSMPLHMMI